MIAHTKLRNVLLATAGAGVLALGLGVSSAHAVTVSDQLFFGEQNSLTDDDAEQLIDNNCVSATGAGCGTIDVGDYLQGVISWNKVEGENGGENFFGAANSNEFTGIFQVQVLTKTAAAVNPGPDDVLGTGDDEYGFTFGPSTVTTFQDTYAGGYAGAMVALYEDTDGNEGGIRNGPTIASDIAAATDTTLVWVWGMGEDTDEQWVAVGDQSPGIPAAGTHIAEFNFQLSSLYDALFPAGLDLVAAGCSGGPAFSSGNSNPCLLVGDSLIEINGSGSVIGRTTGPWPIWSNSDATFAPRAVPEPMTLALFGAGLFGLGWISRRRKSRA